MQHLLLQRVLHQHMGARGCNRRKGGGDGHGSGAKERYQRLPPLSPERRHHQNVKRSPIRLWGGRQHG